MPRLTRHRIYWIIVTLIVFIATFLRLYRIDTSLLFYGDVGRDFLEFQEWQTTNIPPLLGPHTSALPFDQSAFYFYLLMPFYIIFQQSLLSTIFATTLLYVITFIAGAYVLRHRLDIAIPFLISAFLLSIHPQAVSQMRFVWNPSFIPLFLMIAYIAFRLVPTYQIKAIGIFASALAAAVSFSYASVPGVIVFLILTIYSYPHYSKRLVLTFISALAILNLPTLVFELRHNFFLTSKMLQAGSSLTQTDVISKATSLSYYLFKLQLPQFLLASLIVISMALFSYHKSKDSNLKQLLILSILTTCLTLLMPFPLHAHYIFAILTFGILLIAQLPFRTSIFLSSVCAIIMLRPAQLQQYFQTAPRTIAETQSCVKKTCQQIQVPIYVSTQSSFHAQHDAKEYEYLFNRYGCPATDIISPKFTSDYMVVAAEYSPYIHESTSYHEITLFGPSIEIDTIHCSDNYKIHVLNRAQ